MPHAIVIQRRAERDIEDVVAQIARYVSVASASRWHDGLLQAIRTLKDQPERCPLADEADELGFSLRFLVYGRKRQVYRVLFTVEGNEVNIIRVRHAAQNTLTDDDL